MALLYSILDVQLRLLGSPGSRHAVGKIMALSRTDRIRAAEGDLLGHPRGLTFLFTTEMWERFSYYGMRALLVLYMAKYLLPPGHGDALRKTPCGQHRGRSRRLR